MSTLLKGLEILATLRSLPLERVGELQSLIPGLGPLTSGRELQGLLGRLDSVALQARLAELGVVPPPFVLNPLLGPHLSEETLHPYQRTMARQLGEDALSHVSPWLGLVSPMQTGKGHLIPYLVQILRAVEGEETQFVVLSSARFITRQILSDLVGGLGESGVGRYDGLVKDPQQVTVASIYTLFQDRHLQVFPQGKGRRVVILDEGWFTNAPIVRKILCHFGLAQEVREGRWVKIVPHSESEDLLIGLAGFASSLEDYHISGRLELLDALKGGWVRPIVAERLEPKVETVGMRNPMERMVWWRATEGNAEAIASEIERVRETHGDHPKILTFVPTIHHGGLLTEALGKRRGENFFVHSRLEPNDVLKVVGEWEDRGGVMVSIGMMTRGYRATGIDVVFQTFQGSSEERFAQTTGRGWGIGPKGEYRDRPLHVYEVAWDKRRRFTNMARVLGLADFPARRLETGPAFFGQVERMKRRERAEGEIRMAIGEGKVDPLFETVPILEGWRGRFSEAVRDAGGIDGVLQITSLDRPTLEAFLIGSLPVSLEEVEAIASLLGGREQALNLWIQAWEEVCKELEAGMRASPWGQTLLAWRGQEGDLESRARGLDEILSRLFHERGSYVRIDEARFTGVIEEVLKSLEKGETMTPQALAVRAYERYVEGLEGERPSLGTFRKRLQDWQRWVPEGLRGKVKPMRRGN